MSSLFLCSDKQQTRLLHYIFFFGLRSEIERICWRHSTANLWFDSPNFRIWKCFPGSAPLEGKCIKAFLAFHHKISGAREDQTISFTKFTNLKIFSFWFHLFFSLSLLYSPLHPLQHPPVQGCSFRCTCHICRASSHFSRRMVKRCDSLQAN